MGYMKPQGDAAHRVMKAEGGWAVICTEACSIHPSAKAAPYAEKRLWDERDARDLALFAEACHGGDPLAGIELVHWGLAFSNRSSRATFACGLVIRIHLSMLILARRRSKV